MYNSDEGKRKLTRAIVHYIYRNESVIEDNHAGHSIVMDKAFYEKVYRVVYKKLKNVKLFYKYIRDLDERRGKVGLDEVIDSVPEELRFKYMRFFSDITNEVQDDSGLLWDDAAVLEPDLKGKSAANYVLSGHFSECCEKGAVFDDETMFYINTDIHNRVYTLLVNGYFD